MDAAAAHRMGTALLAEHGLSRWSLRFDRAKRRAGQCRHQDRTITISAPLTALHDEAEVRETLLHEIAHALAGPRAGHGPTWRETALRIGSSAERCLPVDSPTVAGAWVGTCGAGHTVQRHRRPERVLSCRRCSPGFSAAHTFAWTHHGRAVPMHPRYVAELERLLAGGRAPDVGAGAEVRILVPGRWRDRRGTVVKVGRTRYHVDVGGAVLAVPMGSVEPLPTAAVADAHGARTSGGST